MTRPTAPLRLALLMLFLAASAPAEEATTPAHGISTFDTLKYPEGFAHFDYVNPDAPKGGTMSFRGTGASRTFDSLNGFILSGEPAQGLERHLRRAAGARLRTSRTRSTG